MKLGPYLTPHTEINSKWFRDLNIYFSEENIGQKLHDIAFGSDFLTMTPKAQATKEKSRQVEIHENFKVLFIKTLSTE